jgi:hypothetical protein
VPLLFVEIDNCFESAQVLAAKIDKCMRFGQRKVKDVDGRERPMWRTRWWVPDGRRGDQPPPPLLLVFNRVGPRNPGTVIAQLAELTERHWKGTLYAGGFHIVRDQSGHNTGGKYVLMTEAVAVADLLGETPRCA